MKLIDFNQSPREAFTQGFLKGLGAPLGLFGSFEMPEMLEVKPIQLPAKSDQSALAEDWRKVGTDLKNALALYAQEH